MKSKIKSIVLSEKHIQQLYSDVADVAMHHRIKISMYFDKTHIMNKEHKEQLDVMLYNMMNECANEAIKSVNKKLK